MKKVNIKLTETIVVHGESVSDLCVCVGPRQMKEFPLEKPKKLGDMYELAAACCDIPPSSLEQLAPGDLIRVIGVVSDFLSEFLSAITPGNPSP